MEMQLSGRGCRPTKSAYSQEHQGFESLGFRRVLSCSSVKFKSIYLVFLSQRGEPDYAPDAYFSDDDRLFQIHRDRQSSNI